MTLNNPSMVDSTWQQMFYNLKFIAGGTVQTVGFILPKYGVIDVRSLAVFTQVADSGVTCDVGFKNATESGDEDGLLDGLDVAATGWHFPTCVLTQGTNALFVSASTYGILSLPTAEKGANTSGHGAVPLWLPFAVIGDGTIKTMTYTLSASDTFEGILTFRWKQLPDPAQSTFQWPIVPGA